MNQYSFNQNDNYNNNKDIHLFINNHNIIATPAFENVTAFYEINC